MDSEYNETAVQQLVLGFETLQEEYKKLHGQHQALERKLATAREQVSPRVHSLHVRTAHLVLCSFMMNNKLALEL